MKKKIEKYFYDYNHTIVLRQHFQCDSQLIVPNILVTLFANSWQDNRNRVTPITAGPLLPPPPSPYKRKPSGFASPTRSFRTAVRDFLRPLLIDLEGSLPHDPIIRTSTKIFFNPQPPA